MASKKQSGMHKGEESDSDSAFYESDNRDIVLKTASLELRSRQIKEFKVTPEKDEKNQVKQWRKWCRDAISELHKLKAYGGGSLANFAAQKLHMEREKQASKTAWEQSEEWADDEEAETDGADLASFSSSARESTTFKYKDLNEAVKAGEALVSLVLDPQCVRVLHVLHVLAGQVWVVVSAAHMCGHPPPRRRHPLTPLR